MTILLTILLSMAGMRAYAQNIEFSDATTKAICVANWDTDHDGELSTDEAAAVTDLGSVFNTNREIKTFNELEYFTGLTSIGFMAFIDCSGLTSITIPNSVISIVNYAFSGCSGLASVTIPNSVTSIGFRAFINCSGLTSVTIPNSMTSIDNWAFYGCSGLTSITIPNSVTSIGDGAFRNCTGLTYIKVESGNEKYDSRNNCNAIIETSSNTLIAGCKNTIIPNSVTSIGNYSFSECNSLKSVTIPNSVTSIGGSAFLGCSGLTSVTIPNSVTSIGGAAFFGCSGLTAVTIGNSVTSIGGSAFYGCSGLTSVTIPNSVTSIGSGAFYYCSGLTSVTIPNSVTSIDEGAFSGCSGLTSIKVENGNEKYDSRNNCNAIIETSSNTLIAGCKNTIIPNSVTSIGNYAFYGCSGLTSVTIPNSVTSIGSFAFDGCKGLTSITIPNSLTSIGESAFRGCSGQTSVTIPNSVTSIGDGAFQHWRNLTTIVSEIENPFAIGNNVFDSSNIDFYATATLIVPDGKKSAYESTEGWNKFKTIIEVVEVDGIKVLPDHITKRTIHVEKAGTLNDIIKTGEMFLIEELTISGELNGTDIKYINEMAGKAISKNEALLHTETEGKLRSLDITNARIVKGGDAYDYYIHDSYDLGFLYTADNAITPGLFTWTKLESILLPNSVTSVNGMSYWDDDLPKNQRLYMGAFPDCLTSVTIPNSVTSIGSHAFYGCTGLASINVESGNEKYDSRNNCNAIIETSSNTLIAGCKNTIIPNSITSIRDYAFQGCCSLTSLTIPNSVTSIGSYVFHECSGLSSITIPNSVTSIGNYAFRGCSGLTSVSIPNSVTSIGYYTFYDCSGLTSVTIGNSVTSIGSSAFYKCTNLTSVTIGNSVTSIGSSAFYKCTNLTSVTIPNSVTSIGGSAFSYCSGLTSITIPNSVTSIGYYAFSGCSGLTSIKAENGNEKYDSRNNCNAIIETSTNTLIAGCKNTIIPNSVTSIGSSAFYKCTNLTSVTIPNSVTSIGGSAFSYCSGLTSVTIPNSVTSIGGSAFSYCSGLTSVIVDIEQPLEINDYTFSNQSNITLYVPKGSKAAYEAADYWNKFKEIKEFVKDNEVTYVIKDDNTVTATAASDPTEMDIVISESFMVDGEALPVTAIGDEAFKGNTDMALVCIPETIEEIGDDAFAGCSGLKAIYSYADEPIALGSAKATVRTRADGDETSASAVFANVDKETCILYVPKNSGEKYRNAAGWGEFQNIVEMNSYIPGDANNDAEVDSKDVEATVGYIMEGKTENFIFKNADVKTDGKINAADIVTVINITNIK